MISSLKVQVLRDHILHEGASTKRPYVYRHRRPIFMEVLLELEVDGLVEVAWKEEQVVSTKITPAGALAFLRAVGSSTGKKSGRDYFSNFIKRNPEFLDRCGPIQRQRVEKYLVLGFMPGFSEKARADGV